MDYTKVEKYQIEITDVDFWQFNPDNPINQGGIRISWQARGIGWGQLDVYKTNEGTIEVDTESMSDEFAFAVLKQLLTKGISAK